MEECVPLYIMLNHLTCEELDLPKLFIPVILAQTYLLGFLYARVCNASAKRDLKSPINTQEDAIQVESSL